MTYIVLIFGQLVPVVRLIIFLGNSLSFGSSRFQDQVVKKLSGVYFRLMHDFSLLWIFDILEVICHIFPSPQNKLPLALCRPGRGGGGVEVSVLVATSCHVSVACRCCCCCSPRHTLLSVTLLTSGVDGPSSHLPAI